MDGWIQTDRERFGTSGDSEDLESEELESADPVLRLEKVRERAPDAAGTVVESSDATGPEVGSAE
jgi:hypothetical protein